MNPEHPGARPAIDPQAAITLRGLAAALEDIQHAAQALATHAATAGKLLENMDADAVTTQTSIIEDAAQSTNGKDVEFAPESNNNLMHQPSQPSVSAIVSAFARETNEAEVTKIEVRNDDPNGIKATQAIVWEEHCNGDGKTEGEIQRREQIWLRLINLLEDRMPDGTVDNGVQYTVKRQQFNGGQLEADVEVNIELLGSGRSDKPGLSQHTFGAIRELRKAEAHLEKPTSGIDSPESLLGVAAVGKPRNRSIPVDALREAIDQQRAALSAQFAEARAVRVTLGASVPGPRFSYNILRTIQITSDSHDPQHQPYDFVVVPEKFLDTNNPPSQEVVLAYLRREAKGRTTKKPRSSYENALEGISRNAYLPPPSEDEAPHDDGIPEDVSISDAYDALEAILDFLAGNDELN